MKVLQLEDPFGRFRVAESCVGLVGCLCIGYAVWTPFWISDRGLWTSGNATEHSPNEGRAEGVVFSDLSSLEAQQVFGVLSFLMAMSLAALCLLFALCWTSETVHSYSNTSSLLLAGQALYPTTLLLLTAAPTGFFFLLSWSLFTHQHLEEIQQNLSCLGSSYWLGALGWAQLLVVQPVVFLVEQYVVPDVMPDLENAVISRQFTTHLRTLSADSESCSYRRMSDFLPRRFTSVH